MLEETRSRITKTRPLNETSSSKKQEFNICEDEASLSGVTKATSGVTKVTFAALDSFFSPKKKKVNEKDQKRNFNISSQSIMLCTHTAPKVPHKLFILFVYRHRVVGYTVAGYLI